MNFLGCHYLNSEEIHGVNRSYLVVSFFFVDESSTNNHDSFVVYLFKWIESQWGGCFAAFLATWIFNVGITKIGSEGLNGDDNYGFISGGFNCGISSILQGKISDTVVKGLFVYMQGLSSKGEYHNLET